MQEIYINELQVELAREYGGTSIAAGTSAYTIGEMSFLPEQHQELPVNFALYRYFLQKENTNLAVSYKTIWEEGLQKLKSTGGNLTTSGVIDENVHIRDYNNFPSGLS